MRLRNGYAVTTLESWSIWIVQREFFMKYWWSGRGFSFPVEVVYERMPKFCTHYKNIGHSLSRCRWLYPRKEIVETLAFDKGKQKVPFKRKEWAPHRTNPSGIGSSNVFEALANPPPTEEPLVTKNIAENSFSFAFQDVTDEVPQLVFPTTEPLLTLVTTESQAAKLSPEGNITILAVTSSVAAGSPLVHVNAQEEPIDDDLVGTTTTTTDTLAAHIVEGTYNADVDIVNKEVSQIAQFVREEGMTHTNPRIQHDLDLWPKIKDYDKRSSETPFVPVLSKKQKQMLKKHQFDSKPPYKTRSMGPIG